MNQIIHGTTTPVPKEYRLDVEMLHTLVKWAMRDREMLDNPAAIAVAQRLHRIAGVHWDQASWAAQIKNGVCKTTGCIAGGAVIEAGYVIDYDDTEDGVEWCMEGEDAVDDKGKTIRVAKEDVEQERIPTVASRLLGLTDTEHSWLFNGDNEIGDVILIARTIAASRGLNLGIDFPEDAARHALPVGGEENGHPYYEVEDGIVPDVLRMITQHLTRHARIR